MRENREQHKRIESLGAKLEQLRVRHIMEMEEKIWEAKSIIQALLLVVKR